MMPILRNMSKYFINTLLLCCFWATSWAQDSSDSTAKVEVKKVRPDFHQLRLSVNVSSPVVSMILKDRTHYEAGLDYYWKNEIYLAIEAGVGGANFDNTDLKYTATNSFVRIGIDKSMLLRLFPQDWDMVHIGLRYGIAPITRNAATFTLQDNFWGTTTGTIPAKKSVAHWASLGVGTRVELFRGFFAGYNLRANFLMNPKAFTELPPNYVAGYGKIEKSTTFDFGVYISYALRWK